MDTTRLRLSAQRALLGAIARTVDAIGVHVDGTRIVLHVAAQSLDEEGREALEVAASEIIADFPEATYIGVNHVVARDAFPQSTTLVFLRFGVEA